MSRRLPVRGTLRFAAAAKVRSGEAAPQRSTTSVMTGLGRPYHRSGVAGPLYCASANVGIELIVLKKSLISARGFELSL